MTRPPVLQLTDVSKAYPGVVAADAVSFELPGGEVHALVGENGAGKSTLINIISGVVSADSGQIRLDGELVRLSGPVDARQRGIVTVHQEADLFPTLSVAENMALAHGLPITRFGFVDWKRVRQDSEAAIARTGEKIDVDASADGLTVGQRHMIQVAAAVTQSARIVILDEPTSALSAKEADWLFEQVERLKADGAGIIYVSHRQEEIFRLADRVTVLRDGRHVWTGSVSEVDAQRLVRLMVGREEDSDESTCPPAVSSRSVADARAVTRLKVSSLCGGAGRVRGISLDAAAGEIVAIYGLIGAGRTEFARLLFGLDPVTSGSIAIDGQACRINSSQDAVRAGIAYVPEDRLRQGICGNLSVRANLVLASLNRWARGPLSFAGPERKAALDVTERLDVRLQSVEQPIRLLSGGNQQKVVLGRWLLNEPKVLILDEPTRGVDVGAKAEIHRLLRRMADDGCTVLMISSELPEVLEHGDRILVLREGTVAGEFDPATATREDVAAAALPDSESQAPIRGNSASAGRRQTAASPPLRGGRWMTAEAGLAAATALLWLSLLVSSRSMTEVTSGLLNLMTYAPLWTLLGLSAAIVIIAGGIDISIGSLVALSAVCTGRVLQMDAPDAVRIPAAMGVGILVGTSGGLLNGAISLLGGVHPIVVTLGTLTVYRGLVILLLGGKSLTDLPDAYRCVTIVPETGFRTILVIALLASAICAVWLRWTRSGRQLFAFGAAPTASRLAGISQARVWLTAFGAGGALAGLAGALELSMDTQMQGTLGRGWELQAIAIAVIGGVSITGGRGTVVGVVLGAILLRLVNSALVRWDIAGAKVELFVGTLLLAAVLIDLFWRKRRR